ncbi:MAG: carbon storage regulator CsrA [Verrucomicrobia bacterium]|nr:carbon storage regulator CsrA [Verrucomicrobiota bacterium]
MLVLSRRINESIVIDGKIIINILRVEGEVVKVGVTAPKEIHVLRKEVYDEIHSNNVQAVGSSRSALERLLNGKKSALQPGKRELEVSFSAAQAPK